MADIAPQILRKLATMVTITVELARWINVPIVDDKHNWARKTILLTMAMSVPIPRICPLELDWFNRPNYIDCQQLHSNERELF